MPVTTWAVCDRNPRTPQRRCRTPRRTRRTYRSVREHPQEVPRHPGGQCSRACVQAVEDAVAAVGRRVEGLHPPHRAGPRCPPDGSRRSHRPGTLRVRAWRGAELHGRGPTPPEHAPQRTTGDGDMTPEGVHGLGAARQLSPSLGPRTAQRCPGPVLPGPRPAWPPPRPARAPPLPGASEPSPGPGSPVLTSPSAVRGQLPPGVVRTVRAVGAVRRACAARAVRTGRTGGDAWAGSTVPPRGPRWWSGRLRPAHATCSR